MRRPGLVAAIGLAGLAVACNALNGAGDLSVADCEGCEAVEAGPGTPEGGVDGAADGNVDDAADGPAPDTSVEGPGGFLDTTFNANGMLESNILDDVEAVAIRPDGRIFVAGQVQNDLAAAAFLSTSTLDMAFGTMGRVVEGMGNASGASAIAFDSRSRAIVGGFSNVVTTVTMTYAYVVRIGATQLDTSFANMGSWRGTNNGDEVRGLAIGPSDAITFAVPDSPNHVFVRLTSAGAPDPTFDDNGLATVADVGREAAGLVARSDGYVSVGSGNTANGQALASAKVSLAGATVLTFGTQGIATSKVGPNNSELGKAIAAQPDGKLVIAGDYDPQMGTLKRVTGVTRFTAGGQIDATYGTGGKVALDLTQIDGRDTETTVRSVAIDAKGRALVVGSVRDKPIAGGNDRFRIWVARLLDNGSLDPLFGTQGKLLVAKPLAELAARGAALQPDGKLVIAGARLDGAQRVFLARIVTTTIINK